MGESGHGEITELLLAWSNGDAAALDKLIPLMYAELRRLARGYMRHQPPDHTLETAALVNEAYLRLIDSSRVKWQDRAHFLAVSAQLMRRIVVDYARARGAQRRGGDGRRTTLSDAANLATPAAEFLDLDEALTELAAASPRKAQVIELRFFGGLSHAETAAVLGVSEDTVRRDWRLGRMLLLHAMGGKHAG
jgi:RNA polymerase sigma-70 factor (ECF subfamily)